MRNININLCTTTILAVCLFNGPFPFFLWTFSPSECDWLCLARGFFPSGPIYLVDLVFPTADLFRWPFFPWTFYRIPYFQATQVYL